MKIICKWVFLTGENKKQMKAKMRPNIQDMSSEEFMEMIISLLAKDETVRVIVEKEN